MNTDQTAVRSAPKRLTLLLGALLAASVLLCAGASSASAVLLGINESGTASEQDMEAVKHSGASVYQLGIVWKRIADAGNWKEGNAWQQTYDVDVERAAKNEVNLIGGLYGRKTEAALHQYYLKSEWGEWQEYVWTVVQRYGRGGAFWSAHPGLPYKPITSWTVWNEPNLAWNNPGETVLPEKYAEFLIATSNTIRSAQNAVRKAGEPNDTRVIHAGLYQPDKGMFPPAFIEKAHNVAGYGGSFDELAVHPYSFAGSQAQKIAGLQVNVETIRTALNNWVSKSKPIWLNELGWPTGGSGEPTVNEAEQAKLLTAAFDWVKANAGTYNIELVTWYFYKNLGGSQWDGYCGLRDQSGKYLESWYAFQKEAGAPKWPIDAAGAHPALVIDPSNGLAALWRGSDGNVYETVAPSGKWITFSPTWENKPAGVTVAGDPAAVIDPSNGLAALWRGSDGNVYETVAPSGKWITFSPTWENKPAGVTVAGDPAAVIDPSNGLAALWRGSDGNVYETVAVKGKWITFSPTWENKPAGVTVAGDPAAVIDPSNGLAALWRGSDGNVYETVAPSGKWITFSPTWENKPAGVTVAGDPAAVIDPSNGLAALWRGSDGNVYETVAPSGKWITFSPTWENKPAGVTVAGDPAAVIDPYNGLTALWRGSDGNVFDTVAPSGKWITFSPTWENKPAGVTVTGNPAAIVDPYNGVTVDWRGTDGNLYETVAVGGKWTTFSPTWGNLPSGVTVAG